MRVLVTWDGRKNALGVLLHSLCGEDGMEIEMVEM